MQDWKDFFDIRRDGIDYASNFCVYWKLEYGEVDVPWNRERVVDSLTYSREQDAINWIANNWKHLIDRKFEESFL